jgi:transketolase
MSSKEVNAMPPIEWQEFATSIVRSVTRHLCPSAPQRTRKQLQHFATEAASITGRRPREEWAKRFEAFLESEPCLRAAQRRYLKGEFQKMVQSSTQLLRTAKRYHRAQVALRNRTPSMKLPAQSGSHD